MPWKDLSLVQQRKAFIDEYLKRHNSVSELCRRFSVSRKTSYKWIHRFRAGCELTDRSRRPHSTPSAPATALEEAIVAARKGRPRWGPKKLRFRLEYNEQRPHEALGQRASPLTSTAGPSASCRSPTGGHDFDYPAEYERCRVRNSGHLAWNDRSVFVSAALKHQSLGLQWQANGSWRVLFCQLPIGMLSGHRFTLL